MHVFQSVPCQYHFCQSASDLGCLSAWSSLHAPQMSQSQSCQSACDLTSSLPLSKLHTCCLGSCQSASDLGYFSALNRSHAPQMLQQTVRCLGVVSHGISAAMSPAYTVFQCALNESGLSIWWKAGKVAIQWHGHFQDRKRGKSELIYVGDVNDWLHHKRYSAVTAAMF